MELSLVLNGKTLTDVCCILDQFIRAEKKVAGNSCKSENVDSLFHKKIAFMLRKWGLVTFNCLKGGEGDLKLM